MSNRSMEIGVNPPPEKIAPKFDLRTNEGKDQKFLYDLKNFILHNFDLSEEKKSVHVQDELIAEIVTLLDIQNPETIEHVTVEAIMDDATKKSSVIRFIFFDKEDKLVNLREYSIVIDLELSDEQKQEKNDAFKLLREAGSNRGEKIDLITDKPMCAAFPKLVSNYTEGDIVEKNISIELYTLGEDRLGIRVYSGSKYIDEYEFEQPYK